MKTKVCKYCRSQIQTKAKICPYCRKPVRRTFGQLFGDAVIMILIIFVGIPLLASSCDSDKDDIDVSNDSYKIEVNNNSDDDVVKVKPETKKDVPIYSEEILFKEISWGASFTYVDNVLGNLNLMPITGEYFVSPSVDAVLKNDNYKGIDFEYNDITIDAFAFNKEIDVAGYTPSDIKLYFAYTEENETLPMTEDYSSFYGAQYIFEPMNLNEMSEDIKTKLIDLYGEIAEKTDDTDIWGNKYTYYHWYGQNNTELMLTVRDSSSDTTNLYPDEICISYAWRNGDDLLQMASDILKRRAIDDEKSNYGNGNNDGL